MLHIDPKGLDDPDPMATRYARRVEGERSNRGSVALPPVPGRGETDE